MHFNQFELVVPTWFESAINCPQECKQKKEKLMRAIFELCFHYKYIYMHTCTILCCKPDGKDYSGIYDLQNNDDSF